MQEEVQYYLSDRELLEFYGKDFIVTKAFLIKQFDELKSDVLKIAPNAKMWMELCDQELFPGACISRIEFY